eukprot:4982157-Amphidinium_carterae.2
MKLVCFTAHCVQRRMHVASGITVWLSHSALLHVASGIHSELGSSDCVSSSAMRANIFIH